MPDIRVYSEVIVTDISGNQRKLTAPGKDRYGAFSQTVAGHVSEKTVILAENAKQDVWDAALEGELDEFDFLWILSDQSDVHVELIGDLNGGVGKVVFTLKMIADQPWMLFSNVTYANYTTDFGGGTLDVIDKIIVENQNATTANIRFVLVT